MIHIPKYQKDFSSQHKILYERDQRKQKASKVISVLKSYLGTDLSTFSLLDIGSSTGIISNYLSAFFRTTRAIDIDEEAVKWSKENFEKENLKFYLMDAMQLEFRDNTFDVVICSHIYEHVPDSRRLMQEIYRVLKPGGICYFAAGNRMIWMEAHYQLPLLSVVPKFIAHRYIRIFKKADYYYEKHLSYFGLKKLVNDFILYDYTRKVIRDPSRFQAEDMIRAGSYRQKLFLLILGFAYWLCPTYIWILKKPDDQDVNSQK